MQIVNEDEKGWPLLMGRYRLQTREAAISPERYKPVTCHNGIKFLSIKRVYAICKLER